MMDLNKKTINLYQLAVCVATPFLGIRSLSLTREIAVRIGQDVWIGIALGCLIATFLSYVAYKATQMFPSKTIIEVNEHVLGKYLGKLISLLMISTILGISALNARLFVDVIKAFLLPLTPIEILLILMLATTTYLIPFGLAAMIRIYEIFVPIVIMFYIALIIFAVGIADFGNLFPILHRNPIEILSAVPNIMPAFLSVGIIYFVMPQVKQSDKAYPYILSAMLICTGITVIINILAVIVLGDSLTHYMYPFVVLTYAVEFQQSFLERIDILFMVMWFLAAFNMLSLMKYWAANSICQVTGLQSPLLVVILISPLLYMISIYPENIMELTKLLQIISPIVAIATVILPLAIALFALIRGMKEVSDEANQGKKQN